MFCLLFQKYSSAVHLRVVAKIIINNYQTKLQDIIYSQAQVLRNSCKKVQLNLKFQIHFRIGHNICIVD